MTKAYENAWGMYCDGDAAYYQKRGREWSQDARDDLEQFGPHVRKHRAAREIVTEDQQYAAEAYSRARFCMGLREEDYNV